MRTLLGYALVGVLLSAIGCGGSSGDTGVSGGSSGSGGGAGTGGAAGGAGPSGQQACSDGAKAVCDAYQSCSNGFLISYVYGDMATCVSVRTELCLTSLDAPGTGSTPATKEACAKETPKESCTDLVDLNDVGTCVTPMGTLENGAACGAAAQCKTAWCEVGPDAVCGKCAALPKVGDACDTGLQCASGQTCNTNTSKCQVPIQEGGACSADATCDVFLGCDDGGTGTGNGTCKALPAKNGASCDPAIGCDVLRGFLCYPPGNTCGPIAYADPGKPCGLVTSTSYAVCTSSAICNIPSGSAAGTCVVPVGEGKDCDTSFGPSCTTGLTCVGPNGTGKCTKYDPTTCH